MPRKSTSTGKHKSTIVREKEGVYRTTQPEPRNEQFDLLTSDQLKEVSTFARVANQGYGICICNIPKLREDLIIGLTEDLKSERIGLYQLRLRSGDRSLGAKIRILLQDEDFSQFRTKYQKVVLSIVGLDETIQETEKKFERRPEALQGLNQQRDYFRTLPFPLLIWVPEWLSAKFPEFAPDFWVARGVVFECLTPSEMVRQSLSQVLGVEVTFKDLNEAKRKMRIYKKLIKSSEDMSIKTLALLNLGILHHMQGDYLKAESLYRESLKLAEGLGDKLGVAQSLYHLGMIRKDTGDYAEAEKLSQQSLGIAEQVDDRSGIARNLHQLGMIKQYKGQYKEAEELYRQSLKILEGLEEKSGVASCLHALGNVNFLKGNWSEAERLYQQSLKMEEGSGNKLGIAQSLHQLGMIKQYKGEYQEAEKLYRQSLKITEELGSKSGVAYSFHQLGMIRQDIGDYSEAERFYRQSLKIKKGLGDRSGIAGTLYQLGTIHFAKGNYESALQKFLAAAEIAKELHHENLPLALNMIEKVKEKLGEAKFQELYKKIKSQLEK
jgi:tetratricopeptide (TPR) repeat protein